MPPQCGCGHLLRLPTKRFEAHENIFGKTDVSAAINCDAIVVPKACLTQGVQPETPLHGRRLL